MELELEHAESGEKLKIGAEGATFGRDGNRADVAINDPAVSGRHAQISYTDGAWVLEDLGSSNGTFIDGHKLTGPAVLRAGQRIAFHRHEMNVVSTGDELPSADEPTAVWEGAGNTATQADAVAPNFDVDRTDMDRVPPSSGEPLGAPGADEEPPPPGDVATDVPASPQPP